MTGDYRPQAAAGAPQGLDYVRRLGQSGAP
jgi:hypothetical protein